MPTPGGPTSVMMAPAARCDAGVSRSAASSRSLGSFGPQLADGHELDDAILHVLQSVVVGLQHVADVGEVEVVLAPGAPRQLERPGRARCGSSRARATASWCARAGRSPCGPWWRPPRAVPSSSTFSRYWPTMSSSPSPSSRRMASSCWRSRYSRCCLSTPSVTSARIDSATCSSATWALAMSMTSWTRSPTSTASSTRARVASSSSAHAGDPVGELAGGRDRAQQLGQPPRPAQLGHHAQHGSQLAPEGLDPWGRAGIGDQLGVGVGGTVLAGVHARRHGPDLRC